MKNATMEQDWADNFSFLQTQDSTEAPFLLILQHASSVKHLEEMLGKWLPPHWQLPREELIKMIKHWKKWYQPYRQSGGTSDHIVRSHVDRLCKGQYRTSHYGLRYLYLKKLEDGLPWSKTFDMETVNNWVILPQKDSDCRWSELHLLFQNKTLKQFGTIGICGIRTPADQEEIWFLMFSVCVTELTEAFTFLLLKLPNVIHNFQAGQGVAICVKLDGSQLKAHASLESHTINLGEARTSNILCVKPEFLPEVQRQLTAMGIPITIVEAESK